MTTDNFVRYPVGPGDFLSMLERVGQLGHWHIRHLPMAEGTITAFGICAGAGSLPNEPAVIYSDGWRPVVKLGKTIFDLMSLFEQGEPWDPKVYLNNPFMPAQFKHFLGQLFAVHIEDRKLRAKAMSLAA